VRLLLDECIPKRLCRELAEHDVRTVQQAGWGGLTNGRLLVAAQQNFDVFLTVDQNLRFQQNISGFEIAVVVLEAPSNDIEDLRPLIPRVLALLPQLRPGQVLRVGAEGET
jgi:predicted nuclease of predicted toxin-antitoxin system